MMQNISVTRYKHPKSVGWAGYVEPEDKSWIVFVGLDGRPLAFLNRDPETGAICPNDPAERAQFITQLRDPASTSSGNHTGETNAGSAAYSEGTLDPLERGEVVQPLGVSGGGDVEPRRK